MKPDTASAEVSGPLARDERTGREDRPSDDVEVSAGFTRDLASWTHLWFSAAVHTALEIESEGDHDDPTGSTGRRYALSLVLIDAIRNVYRGSVGVLGQDHPGLTAFTEALPSMKELRDRLEHFDEYVRGSGRHQRNRPADGAVAMTFSRSFSGADGHTIVVDVRESSGHSQYEVDTGAAIKAARALVLTTVTKAALDGDQHRERCWLCRPELASVVRHPDMGTPTTRARPRKRGRSTS